MGILNVTPDSFYEDSRCFSDKRICSRAEQILSEGGDIIDIGGYSTRPGHEPISEEEELSRVSTALDLIRREFPDALVSVDTFRARVAEVSVRDYGADIINDVCGGDGDPLMFETVASLRVPYILMHMKGEIENIATPADYDDIYADVYSYFERKIRQLNEMGVEDIVVDPGYGFAKSISQNFELMRQMEGLKKFNLPILVGISRKRMLWQLLESSPGESLNATTALNALLLSKGADILRVHDVKEAVEVVKIYNALNLS